MHKCGGFPANECCNSCHSNGGQDSDAPAVRPSASPEDENSAARPSHAGGAPNWPGVRANPDLHIASGITDSWADPRRCSCADSLDDRRPPHSPPSASTVSPPSAVPPPPTSALQTNPATPACAHEIDWPFPPNIPPRCGGVSRGSCGNGRESSGNHAENTESPRSSGTRPETHSASPPSRRC